MAKRSKKRKTVHEDAAPVAIRSGKSSARPGSNRGTPLREYGIALLLAVIAFLIYAPSLKSDFVYDAPVEIQEGFFTDPSHLAEVLSLKVLSMHLLLGDRPGQLLYLMLIAAAFGVKPFAYHLGSNLLHAVNVAMLFVLLLRLARTESVKFSGGENRRLIVAVAAVVLIFALHPISVEPVAAVSYSSDLLVMFFAVAALLAATAFDPGDFRSVLLAGSIGTFCAFAAVACKESGSSVVALLVVYWFLFRRGEAKGPWLWFLGSAATVTVAFLAARFLLAPPVDQPPDYLNGSLGQVFLVQPRIWVFMMGKLVWPFPLSADYRMEDLNGLSAPGALVILAIVFLLQTWLARNSRIGAMGVAIYWLGLVVVSNFIPLYRPNADRFYYLPLAGVAAQLLALLLLLIKSRDGFWVAATACFVALVPLTWLTLVRQDIFVSDFALWSATVQVSPYSSIAHLNLGHALYEQGKTDEAIAEIQTALNITPSLADAHNDLGSALVQKGKWDEAMTSYREALQFQPNHADAHYNLGVALFQKGLVNEAIEQFEKAIELRPYHVLAHNNLGAALLQEGRTDEAIAEFQTAIKLDPNYLFSQYNLGHAFLKAGRLDEALAQLQAVVENHPDLPQAHLELGKALVQEGRLEDAIAQLQEAVRLDPGNKEMQDKLAQAQALARPASHPSQQ
jgi:protein O-mannosyl-transferase